jgi:hypothetical protein
MSLSEAGQAKPTNRAGSKKILNIPSENASNFSETAMLRFGRCGLAEAYLVGTTGSSIALRRV